MQRHARQSAFTLMEVMFAVAILAMGMVFVASMFPLGIANCKKVADATLAVVNAHNAALEAKLRMDDVTYDDLFSSPDPTVNLVYGPVNGDRVYYQIQPNLRQDEVLVLDDPQERYLNIRNLNASYGNPSPIYYSRDYRVWNPARTTRNITPFAFAAPTTPGELPYWLQVDYTDATYRGPLAKDALAQIVFPTVDSKTPEVQAQIPAAGFTFPVDLPAYNQILFDVARTRNYNTALFYRHIPGSRRRFTLYTFTLQRRLNEASYAIQGLTGTENYAYTGSPVPCVPAELRHYPAPWFIAFFDPADTGRTTPKELLNPGGTRLTTPYGNLNNDNQFILNDFMPNLPQYVDLPYILLPGTVILNEINGDVLRVVKNELLDPINGRPWQVTLNKPLEGSLTRFWVFPPPMKNTTTGDPAERYHDFQPVIDVQTTVVEFSS